MFACSLVVLVILQNARCLQDPLISDLDGLSELPLEKLLQVKNSLDQHSEETFADDRNGNEETETIATSLNNPEALALHGKLKKPYQRGSYEASWEKKGGKKGLSTIFQITITALAFLAFAGYLLCLLVQAIKNKSTTTTTATTGNGALVFAAPIKRRRPTGYRQRRAAPWLVADPEDLYYALKTFSEGYATYHTVDYKYYNFTVDTFG